MNLKISVILPIYNKQKYIKQAISSILSQTFSDFELIVINDASTDGSEKIIKQIKDKRIKYFRNKKQLGLAKTLNKGIKLAKGKYIARMDADDISLPNRLEQQYNFMQANPNIGLCGTWIQIINKAKTVWKYPADPDIFHCNLIFNNSMAHPTAFFRKNLFIKHKLFYNPNFIKAQDWELWSRCCQYFKCTNIPKVLLKYRVNNKDIIKFYGSAYQKYPNKIRKKQLKLIDIEPTKKELELHQNISNDKITTEDILKAIKWLKRVKFNNQNKQIFPVNKFNKLINQKITKCYQKYLINLIHSIFNHEKCN